MSLDSINEWANIADDSDYDPDGESSDDENDKVHKKEQYPMIFLENVFHFLCFLKFVNWLSQWWMKMKISICHHHTIYSKDTEE